MRMFFTLVLAAATMFGCTDKEATEGANLELNFRGVFGDQPLMMYERSYPYEAGMEVKFQRFNFYVSEVVLVPEDAAADPVRLVDVDLINFEDVQNADAAGLGISLRAEEVPPGRYRALRLGVGLTPEQNSTQPADYPAGHPMTDNYWSWALGYVFFKVEGNADLNGDGEFTEKLTFHIGGNDYYQPMEFPAALELGSDQNARLDFEVDLKRVLSDGSGNFVDFRQVTQDHTNDADLATFLSGNFQRALRVMGE